MKHEPEPSGRGEPMHLWCVAASPSDIPGLYVARLWIGEQVTDHRIVTIKLDVLRDVMRGMGLFPIPRMPQDDPCIVETWI